MIHIQDPPCLPLCLCTSHCKEAKSALQTQITSPKTTTSCRVDNIVPLANTKVVLKRFLGRGNKRRHGEILDVCLITREGPPYQYDPEACDSAYTCGPRNFSVWIQGLFFTCLEFYVEYYCYVISFVCSWVIVFVGYFFSFLRKKCICWVGVHSGPCL